MDNGLPDKPMAEQFALTRRGFLAGAAGWAGAIALGQDSSSNPRDQAVVIKPKAPRVVVAESQSVFRLGVINKQAVGELVDKALAELLQVPNAKAAWPLILGDASRVGLKFNGSGAAMLGTNGPIAGAIVGSLKAAGYGQLSAAELPESAADELGVEVFQPKWMDEPSDFGSGSDNFSHFVTDVNALINISFLKHHNIAGFSACLKNLSHGLIKHPARFHSGGCSPFIPHIVAHPHISNVLKLNIVNGMRIVVDKGPEPGPDNILDSGFLLMGLDPVAVDAMAFGQLNRARQNRGLAPLASGPEGIRYLAAAAECGLGEIRRHAIEVRKVEL